MTGLLVTTFRFAVNFNLVPGMNAKEHQVHTEETLGDGGFQEVSGLEVEMDIQDYEVGGRNDGVVRRVGRANYQPLVCKRGMFALDGGRARPELWRWFQDVVSGVRPVRRYNGSVVVFDGDGQEVATWLFRRALPAKIVGPQLDARRGEIAIEELHLAHEGLVLEIPESPT